MSQIFCYANTFQNRSCSSSTTTVYIYIYVHCKFKGRFFSAYLAWILNPPKIAKISQAYVKARDRHPCAEVLHMFDQLPAPLNLRLKPRLGGVVFVIWCWQLFLELQGSCRIFERRSWSKPKKMWSYLESMGCCQRKSKGSDWSILFLCKTIDGRNNTIWIAWACNRLWFQTPWHVQDSGAEGAL